MRRALALPLFLMLFLAAVAILPLTQAHANLVRADPAPNSFLQTPPDSITLLFSEELEPSFTEAVLLDSSGARESARFSVFSANKTVIIDDIGKIKDGVYTVSWKALSVIDGHTTTGSFPLIIGNATLIKPIKAEQRPTETAEPITILPAESIVRWINFVGQTALVGGMIFWIGLWRPSSRKLSGYKVSIDENAVEHVSSSLTRISIIVTLFSAVLLLVIQSSDASAGSSIMEALPKFLLQTRLGIVWIAKIALLAMLLAVFFVAKVGLQTKHTLGLVLGVSLLATTSLTGHTAAASEAQQFGFAVDLVHLVGVSAWVGGIIHLTAVLPAAFKKLQDNHRGLLVAILIPRFSSIAVLSIGTIGLTGFYMALLHLGSFGALFSTAYGNFLIIKVILVAIPVLLGAVNQFLIHPKTISALKSAQNLQSLSKFRTSIGAEAILGISILLLAGFLTSTPPAVQSNDYALQILQDDFSAPQLPLFSAVSEGVNITLKIEPMQVGLNTFEVVLRNEKGELLADVRNAEIEFMPAGANIGSTTANLQKSGEGVYSASGAYLSIPDSWKAIVKVQRENAYDAIADFNVIVPFEDRFSSFRVREYELQRNDARPYDIFAGHGKVWFTVPNLGMIGAFDVSTFKTELFTLPGSSLPTGIAVANEQAWITDPQNNRILHFDSISKSFKEYRLSAPDAVPSQITIDRGGIVWFVAEEANQIMNFNPSNESFKNYNVPTQNAGTKGIFADAQGIIWFTEFRANKIGALNPSGIVTEYTPADFTLNAPTGIAVSDGIVWVTEHGANKITQFDPKSNSYKRFDVTGRLPAPFDISIDANGSLWFAEHLGNRIGAFNPETNQMHHFDIPTQNAEAQWLSIDKAGNVWFGEAGSNKIGVITKTLSVESPKVQDDSFRPFITISAVVLVAGTIVAFVGGRRRFESKLKELDNLYTKGD